MRVEVVQVVLPGPFVEGPQTGLVAGEDGLVLGVADGFVTPDVVVAECRASAASRRTEPRMAVRRVVHDEVHDHAQPVLVGGSQEDDDVAQ